MNVLVVGSLNVDTTFMLDHIPVEGETILSEGISNSMGGKGQNQAVAMSRLGINVSMIGAVGNDDKGRNIIASLEKENIDTSGIVIKSNTTGLASIYLDKRGRNNIVVHPGANFDLSVEDINALEKMFADVDYCVMQFETPLDVIYRVLEICNEKEIKTIVNPAPAVSNFDLKYMKYIDYLIPNETELEILSGEKIINENIEELAEKILFYGSENVIVTLGSKGSFLINKDSKTKVKAKKVDVVDTTAAGDSFIGGFTTALVKGKEIREALEFATNVASKTIQKKGAINSLPYINDL